jgi:hypothetical protein
VGQFDLPILLTNDAFAAWQLDQDRRDQLIVTAWRGAMPKLLTDSRSASGSAFTQTEQSWRPMGPAVTLLLSAEYSAHLIAAYDAFVQPWAPDALIRLPSLESGVNTWAARATSPSAERVGILGRFLTGGTVR